ncbi:hypothetical protein [Pedobacter rhizosphaerae]|uniref:DUF5017 domain-containing protein n=1 Tax=Pedobacter rhizosphaerae TaxID=390241 RepID=A0A1H9PTA2_9SPHI|nr:hypothetical protein [Pedobacter rhizosphaerae]SER51444.1 hypothetical protein SAMN04488023_11098 [Pedobacter rhizosphaerae]
MKSRKLTILTAIIGFALSLAACKKTAPNIYNMFDDVAVTFKSDYPFSIVDYKDINDGDSVYLSFTITSAKEDMAAVCVRREGVETPVLQINLPDNVDKRSYTGVYKFKVNRVGESKYRVYALNKQATYIGDGYKSVSFNVRSNFTLVNERKLYLPDSVSQDLPSYYSIKRGESFSYAQGKDVSADLDFGIYRTPAPQGDANAIVGYWYHIYSLSASPLFFNKFDISSWTKRATLFSAQAASDANSFTNNLVSGSTIQTIVGAKTINLKETPRTSAGSIKVGSVVYFKTPEGKLGAIHFKSISADYNGKVYFAINVKVQD